MSVRKCSSKGFCKVVRDVLDDDAGSKRHGIYINQYYNRDTGKLFRRIVIRYAEGVVRVNHCPFCGSKTLKGVEVSK